MVLLRRRAVPAACLLACSWAVLVVAAPWLASSPRGIGARVSALSYVVGSLVCHQQPGRSFHIAGGQLPVCARCTALYLGGACGLTLGLFLHARGVRDPVQALAAHWSWRTVVAWAALPMLLAIGLEWSGVWTATNAWRAALSLPAGWVGGALAAEFLSFRVTL